jgi:hypothetical protein
MDKDVSKLSDRLDSIGWGLLFLLFAALALPRGTAEFASVAAVGTAMVGLNLVRRMRGLEVAWFSLILGAAVAIAGIGAMASLKMDVFVLFFALAGTVTIGAALLPPINRAA